MHPRTVQTIVFIPKSLDDVILKKAKERKKSHASVLRHYLLLGMREAAQRKSITT